MFFSWLHQCEYVFWSAECWSVTASYYDQNRAWKDTKWQVVIDKVKAKQAEIAYFENMLTCFLICYNKASFFFEINTILIWNRDPWISHCQKGLSLSVVATEKIYIFFFFPQKGFLIFIHTHQRVRNYCDSVIRRLLSQVSFKF